MKKKFLIPPIIILIAFFGFFMLSSPATSIQHENLGSNELGVVTKDTYSHKEKNKVKIAVISGMHPREKLATNVVPQVVKKFAHEKEVEIVNYQVNVTYNPDHFYIGRDNGEALVKKFVVPDIVNSDCDLVIIAHDHEKGYGNGSYIATPTRDDNSIALGEAVHKLEPEIRFYPGIDGVRKQASSVKLVDKPISDAGKPVFVYELPEWTSHDNATQTTYWLLDASLKALQL